MTGPPRASRSWRISPSMSRWFLNRPELQGGRPSRVFHDTLVLNGLLSWPLTPHRPASLCFLERRTLTATECSPALLAERGKATVLPTFLSPSRKRLQSNDEGVNWYKGAHETLSCQCGNARTLGSLISQEAYGYQTHPGAAVHLHAAPSFERNAIDLQKLSIICTL